MKKFAALLLLLPVLASADEENVRLGKYSCVVEAAHPNSGHAKGYVGSRLEYDADKVSMRCSIVRNQSRIFDLLLLG